MGGSGMKQGIYTITENRPLTADVWEMRLSGDTSPLTAPGQFINIKLEGFFLRRPISVCDWDEAGLTDRKSTRLNSSHVSISYAVFCLKNKKTTNSSILSRLIEQLLA